MKNKKIISGIAVKYRLGSKGTRYVLTIDDPKIAPEIQEQLDQHNALQTISKDFLDVNYFLRNKKVIILLE